MAEADKQAAQAALVKEGLPEDVAQHAAARGLDLGGLLNLLRLVQTQAPQLISLIITLINGFGGKPATGTLPAAGQPKP